MAIEITHATPAVGTDSGDDKVSKDAWEEGHVVTGIVRGAVSDAGAVVRGSGFTAAQDATGKYTVTFDAAFAAAPIVVATSDVGAVPQVQSVSTTTAVLWFYITGSFFDSGFDFIAIAV